MGKVEESKIDEKFIMLTRAKDRSGEYFEEIACKEM